MQVVGVPNESGVSTVTLNVTDALGQTATITFNVVVEFPESPVSPIQEILQHQLTQGYILSAIIQDSLFANSIQLDQRERQEYHNSLIIVSFKLRWSSVSYEQWKAMTLDQWSNLIR